MHFFKIILNYNAPEGLGKLEKAETTETKEHKKTEKKRYRKVQLLRVKLPPPTTLKPRTRARLKYEEYETITIGYMKDTLNSSERKIETKSEALTYPNKLEKKESKNPIKKGQNKKLKIKTKHKLTPKVEKKKIKQIKKVSVEDSYSGKIGLKFIIALILIITTSLIGGYYTSIYLYEENEANLFGLLIVDDKGIYTNTIRIEGTGNHEFLIKNTNKQPVIIDFITWGWTSSEIAEKVFLKWDYDDTPIPPGFICKVNLFASKESEEISEFSFNVNFLTLVKQ